MKMKFSLVPLCLTLFLRSPKNQVCFSTFPGPEPMFPAPPAQPVRPLGSRPPRSGTSATTPTGLRAQAPHTVRALRNVSMSFKIIGKKYAFRSKNMF